MCKFESSQVELAVQFARFSANSAGAFGIPSPHCRAEAVVQLTKFSAVVAGKLGMPSPHCRTQVAVKSAKISVSVNKDAANWKRRCGRSRDTTQRPGGLAQPMAVWRAACPPSAWLLRDQYNQARTHLSVNKDAPSPRTIQAVGRIVRTPFLVGLHTNSCTSAKTLVRPTGLPL
jgi:hypothetical protein